MKAADQRSVLAFYEKLLVSVRLMLDDNVEDGLDDDTLIAALSEDDAITDIVNTALVQVRAERGE